MTPATCGAAIEVPFQFSPLTSSQDGSADSAAPGAVKSMPSAPVGNGPREEKSNSTGGEGSSEP